MELTPSQKETVRHEFDRLCRMVLRGEAIDYDNHIAWRSKHETSLSWLSESQEGQLGVLDEYPCERFCFQVQGYNIPIRNEILANALVKLSEKKTGYYSACVFSGHDRSGDCGQAGYGPIHRAAQTCKVS